MDTKTKAAVTRAEASAGRESRAAESKAIGPSMPLRCLDPAGRSIQAFDLADEQWLALEVENKRARHLKMPCCSAQVILKRSRLGTRFFAHKAVGACTTAAETEAHLLLKAMAVEAARAHCWSASTEVPGLTPSGEARKADVPAQKGGRKLAIEIQWSSETNDEILRRQQRYRESAIRGLWLLRQPRFPITQELPAARIGGSPEEGFAALIPSDCGHHALPMREFLNAVFSRRFRFGVQVGAEAIVSVHAGGLWCWSCGAETTIIIGIDVACGANELSFTIPDLGEHAQPLENVLSRVPGDLEIGSIKPRFSKTQNRSYVSNGCFHCGALIGEFTSTTPGTNRRRCSPFRSKFLSSGKRPSKATVATRRHGASVAPPRRTL